MAKTLLGRFKARDLFKRRRAAPSRDAATLSSSRTAEGSTALSTLLLSGGEISAQPVDPDITAAPAEGRADQPKAAVEEIDIYPIKNRHPRLFSGDRINAFVYACMALDRVVWVPGACFLAGIAGVSWSWWALVLCVPAIVGSLLLYAFAPTCVFKVPNNHQVVIESYGRIVRRVARPGLNFKLPDFLQTVRQVVDCRLRHIDCALTCKTHDNALLTLPVSIHFQIEHAETFADVHDPLNQMSSLVLDRIRNEVARLTLNEVFEAPGRLQTALVDADGNAPGAHKGIVGCILKSYGIKIERVLMNEPIPSEGVKRALDEKAMVTILAEAEHRRAQVLAEAKALYMGAMGRQLGEMRLSQHLTMEETLAFFLIYQTSESVVEASGNGSAIFFATEALNPTLTALLAADTVKGRTIKGNGAAAEDAA